MTNCQNCGEEGECNEDCRECGAIVDPCGDAECHTCVEQFMVFDTDGAEEEDDSEHDECPIECRCTGSCALASIEQEINENAKAERERERR